MSVLRSGMSLAGATILLVDDELAIVQGLIWSLRRQPYRLLTATSAGEALGLLALQRVDVVVSDQQMPAMTGIELLSLVSRRFPSTGRVLLTGHATVAVALRAVNEGQACRVLLKPCPREEFLAAVRAALGQGQLASASSRLLAARTRADATAAPTHREPLAVVPSGQLAPLSAMAGFSSREAEVLDLLARGHRVEQIAQAMFLSQHTVRNHLKAMFRKAGVHSQAELMSLARRGG